MLTNKEIKICIIKQYYDVFGPFTSFKYNNVTTDFIIKSHLSKLNGLESILLFKADYYILNKYNFKRSECEAVKNNTMEKNILNIYTKNIKNTINEEDIPYGEYDVIWCRDPILNNIDKLKTEYPNTLFIYEEVEHERGSSEKSKYYDLILLHHRFDKMNININNLPLTISFPYPKCPNILRNITNTEKKLQIYIDYRDLNYYTLNRYLYNNYSYQNDKILIKNKLNDIKNKYKYNITCNLNNSLNGCCISLNDKSDIYEYLGLLGESKYYCSTSGRVGQALVDACCLKCICFGVDKSPNHRILCHPFTLFNNFTPIEIIINKINYLESNQNLQEEILRYQEEKLIKNFVNYQLDILKKAIKIKKNM